MANEAMQRQWNSPEFLKVWRRREATSVGSVASKRLLDTLRPEIGERMMDVGCGSGLSTIEGAKAVGTSGHVTGADISEELLSLARQRAADADVSNISFVNADVQIANVPGAPFDAAFSQFGVMFFEDPVAAFANIRRHMKPDARLVFICLQALKANEWYPSEILARYEPPRPPSRFPPPSPFALGDQASTEATLAEAGFVKPRFEAISGAFDAAYDPLAFAPRLAGLNLPPDVSARALAEIQAHESKYVTNGRYVTERKGWIVTASS